MARLAAAGTGTFTTAGTWGTIDGTSYADSQSAAATVPTSYASGRSNTFTPGAITIDGIAVKLCVRTGTTGTMSVALYNSTAGADVAGTEVTINTADLPVAAQADINGGWIFFKFSAPVLLLAATNYAVECKTSSSNQVNLWISAGTNWSRYLRTTTTASPAAGDDMVITREYTGTGASTTITVTYDQTATTDYGSTPTAANSLLTPGIAICTGGKLIAQTTAATNYNLKISNSIIVYSGGELDIGTVGGEIPRDSSFYLQFDCGANVDYGLTIRNLGTLKTQGLSRTSGKDIDRCLLNTDEAVNSTSLGVDTDTGWLDNDAIAVASTTRTLAQSEKGALNGNAGASTLTVDGFAGAGGGLAFAHSGTTPVFAEVILLTRNVRISGASSSLQSYIRIEATAQIDCRWTEFFFLGSSTTNNRGININTTTGSTSFDYCSLHDFIVNTSRGFDIGTAGTEGNYSLTNIVTFNVEDRCFNQGNTTTGTGIVISNWVVLRAIGSQANFSFLGPGGSYTNITVVGGSNPFSINTTSSLEFSGTYSDWYARAGTAAGISINSGWGGTFTNMKAARGASSGIFLNGVRDAVFDNAIMFGNTTSNMSLTAGLFNITFNNASLNGDSTFSTTNGLTTSSTTDINVTFINSSFGVASGALTAHTNDINISQTNTPCTIKLINCFLSSGTQVTGQAALGYASTVRAERLQQTDGNHKSWKRYGTIAIDTTIFNTAAPSQRCTPNNASKKLNSGSFKVNVNDGQTCTPAVYVYKSTAGDGAAYNGNQPRLVVLRNDAMGITADTVLDTMSVGTGSWEQLTGTTATVIDNGVLEFVVDCDGTTGWINIDDASATVT